MEKFEPATKTLFSCQPYKNLLSLSDIFLRYLLPQIFKLHQKVDAMSHWTNKQSRICF